jgi:hypothetical protein
VPNGEKKVRPEQGLSCNLLSYEEAANRLGFRRESDAYDPEAHLLFSSVPGTGTVGKWFPLFPLAHLCSDLKAPQRKWTQEIAPVPIGASTIVFPMIFLKPNSCVMKIYCIMNIMILIWWHKCRYIFIKA